MIFLTDLIVDQTASLSGAVPAPSSKSVTHRVLIAAALSEGRSRIYMPLICDDTLATVNACRLIGAKMEQTGKETFEVLGQPKPKAPVDIIDCRDSGSTMRFLTPICALADGISVLAGGESLRKRPMEPVLEALRQLGVRCHSAKNDGYPPIVVSGGGIRGGEVCMRGDVSSQFISGLLFALPLARADSDIVLLSLLESKPYVDITLNVLERYGVEIQARQDYSRFHVPSQQRYDPCDHVVEGDYSAAAFLLAAAAATNSRLSVENLRRDSLQGDRVIVDLLERMGVKTRTEKDSVEVQGLSCRLNTLDIDLRDNPDLVPACAVLACLARGKSVIRGTRRLQFKESDRVATLVAELTKMGANMRAPDDVLEVIGVEKLKGAELDSHRDHRVGMACAIAALMAEGSSVVHGVECINKSYPDFIRDLVAIGGRVVER